MYSTHLMQIRVHSTRLAVSFLLGIVFMLPPVVKPTSAAFVPPLEKNKLASNTDYCSYDSSVKVEKLYKAFTLLPYQNNDTYLTDSIVIAKEKSKKVSSVAPAKTILRKAETDNIQIIEVTPAPYVPVTTPVPQDDQVKLAGQSGAALQPGKLFQLVNDYRVSIGLAPVEYDQRVCEITNSRAPEITNEIYGSSYMHAGFQSRNLPYWASEIIIHMRTEEEALRWWLNSPVHRAQIQGNYKYACLSCSGNSCVMIFTNFEPKFQQAQPVASNSSLNK